MLAIPKGFRFAGHHAGIKKASQTEDITLIVCDEPCVAAGAYTQNQVVAAPVIIDRERTPSASIRAIVVNSGNANACTGPTGMANAQRMLAVTAESIECDANDVLIMSTGIIGEQLPMDKVEQGIRDAAPKLGSDEPALHAAARGIMTTDTKSKIASRTLSLASGDVAITGIAKGSGMIGPNMATMLGAVMTDARLTPEVAQRLLTNAVQDSFNSISVDGHTSTNDTVLLLASGANPCEIGTNDLDKFSSGLRDVCIDLAKQIVDDGEGATHLIEITVLGAASNDDARTFAAAIANSPLVKTAIAGNDPNWGRIISAAGYAGRPMEVTASRLVLNGIPLYEEGSPLAFDASAASQSLQHNRNVSVEMTVGKGTGSATFWTCDLTHEYVTINADYHT